MTVADAYGPRRLRRNSRETRAASLPAASKSWHFRLLGFVVDTCTPAARTTLPSKASRCSPRPDGTSSSSTTAKRRAQEQVASTGGCCYVVHYRFRTLARVSVTARET